MRIEFSVLCDEIKQDEVGMLHALGIHTNDLPWIEPFRYKFQALVLIHLKPGESPPRLDAACTGPTKPQRMNGIPVRRSSNPTRCFSVFQGGFDIDKPGAYEIRFILNDHDPENAVPWRVHFPDKRPPAKAPTQTQI